MKVYAYKGCGTCKKAIKWLRAQEIEFDEIAIRETPPSLEELKQALAAKGQLKALFNTSGMDYRSMGLKDKFADLSESEALELLTTNGNLVKRPLVIAEGIALVGFKQEDWERAFSL